MAWVQLVRQDAGWALKVTNGDLSGQYLYNPVNDKNYLEGATEIKAVATIGVSDALQRGHCRTLLAEICYGLDRSGPIHAERLIWNRPVGRCGSINGVI